MTTRRGTECNKGRVAPVRSQTFTAHVTAYSLSASFCPSFLFAEKASQVPC